MRHVQPWPRPMTEKNSRVGGALLDSGAFADFVWTDERAHVDTRDPPNIMSMFVPDRTGRMHRVTPEPKIRGKVRPVRLEDGKWAWAKIEKAAKPDRDLDGAAAVEVAVAMGTVGS